MWSSQLNGKTEVEASNKQVCFSISIFLLVFEVDLTWASKTGQDSQKDNEEMPVSTMTLLLREYKLISQGGRELCGFQADHDWIIVNLSRFLHTAKDLYVATVVKQKMCVECSKLRKTVLKAASWIMKDRVIVVWDGTCWKKCRRMEKNGTRALRGSVSKGDLITLNTHYFPIVFILPLWLLNLWEFMVP